MTGIVYQWRNIANDKVYIGSTYRLQGRKKEHLNALNENKHHSITFQRAWNKYGELGFVFEILEQINRFEEELLIDFKERLVQVCEQTHLDRYGAQDFINKISRDFRKKTYNINPTANSMLGSVRSAKVRAKLLKRPQVFKKGQRSWNKGTKGIIKKNEGSWQPNHIPWNKDLKGIHLSPQSQFEKGREPWNKGRSYDQIKGAKHHASKAVIQLTLDYVKVKEYDCMTDINNAGFYRRGVKQACEKKFGICKDFRWCYSKDYTTITSIEHLEETPDYVYNIEVEGNHNYFVNGILTHNCDDPQNPRMAASEVERKNTINYYNNTLYSRLNQPELGVRIIIMQRLHEEDLSGHLVETSPEKHDHICIPVEVDRNNLEKALNL